MVDFSNLKKPYLIGEIGINHNGDINIVKKLMCAVSATGWNCAKFQKRTPNICVPKSQWNKMRSTPWGEMSYIDYKKKIELTRRTYNDIDDFAKNIGVDWSASVWDVNSLEFLMKYDVPFIKIPSAKITDLELIREVSKLERPIIISTGMSTLQEIDMAIDILLNKTDDVCVMHTNSSYPTPRDELNLCLVSELIKRYGLAVGYSGHEEDLEPTCAAVVLGARVIERHITLDHNMWGTDQKASLEVHAMNMLRKRIEDIPVMLGSPNKKVTQSEELIRNKLRGN